MIDKEVAELRRRYRQDRSNITKIHGCYVNVHGELVSAFTLSMGLLPEGEQEKYLELLKKGISGRMGKTLSDLSFSTAQVADSDEHRLLQTLRQTECKDVNARETLCRKIIESLSMGETNYLILLAADAYDVPYRGKDDELQADASSDVYKYFVCAICPVKAPTLELRYDTDENFFHPSSTGHIALAPELGFLFPAFDDREANIYNALFYSKNVELIHEEVIDAVFRVEPPMSAVEQKNVFDTALADTLEKDCSYDVVQSVHEQLRGRIQEHKENRDPAPLELTVGDVGGILSESGVSEEKVESFRRECEKQYGENAALNPKNILGTGKFEITTPEVKITVAPENSYLIEARMIGGRRYLLIPADDGVEVNGVSVSIPNEEHS